MVSCLAAELCLLATKKKWWDEFMRQKIMKVGNSVGVTVPADFVKSIGVRAGDSVDVKTKPEKGEVVYKFSGIQQLAFSSNFLKKKKKK